ncbi:MAG: hypothetical protein ABW171_13130 [Steroidobacter sp.]
MNELIQDPRVWHRIAPYLDQAFDLPPEQLGAWLDDLQSTQPDIATSLRALLAERDLLNATGFLAEPMLAAGVVQMALSQLLLETDGDHGDMDLSRALDHLSRTVNPDHPALLQVRKLLHGHRY